MIPKKDLMKALRDKRKAEGLVKLEIWIKPEWKPAIFDFLKFIATENEQIK